VALRGARWLAVFGGVLVLGAAFGLLSSSFLQFRNLENIAVQAGATGVMAVGMTFVIMTAGIDISVGAILYLTAALTVQLAGQLDAPLALYPVAVLLGALLGLINGALTVGLRINPLITTLATFSVYRGLAIQITGAEIEIVPESIRYLGNGTLGGVSMPIIVSVGVGIVAALVIRYTRLGRYVLAVGASERSARESALPVRKVLLAVYAIAGACAGLGGLILIGRVGSVQSDMGIGIEFTVITAVVLGGTYLSGGRGSIAGSLMGAVLLVMIDNGLNQMNASPFVYDIVRGSVLIGAVGIDRAARVGLAGPRLFSRNALGG
jgi:ribose transport system permease protein